MQRKPQDENTDGAGSRSSINEQDAYIVRRREEKHDRAFVRLKKTFDNDDFSAYAANRIGVDTHILKELVALGFVRCFEGRFDLKFRPGYLTGEFEIPVPVFTFDSDFMRKYQTEFEQPIESKAHRESVELFFAGKIRDSSPKRSGDQESMHYVKRFRWPRSIYLLLSSRYRNLSAYIRYLVYSDLGMEKEAERERARMGPRV